MSTYYKIIEKKINQMITESIVVSLWLFWLVKWSRLFVIFFYIIEYSKEIHFLIM